MSTISSITNHLPTLSIASPAEILRNARTVAIGAVALAVLTNLPQAEAGPLAGILAGLGTVVVGGTMLTVGVILAPTGIGVGLAAAGSVVIGQAPLVAASVGMTPTV